MNQWLTIRDEWMDMSDLPLGDWHGVRIERREIKAQSIENFRIILKEPGRRGLARDTIVTQLWKGNHLWMSDTPDEKRDHFEAAMEIANRGGRVLIGGLGLGMIVRAALMAPGVTHVDVVEIDNDVIKLVGPYYKRLAREQHKSLIIHRGDLYEKQWPVGSHWNVAWFDIWLAGDWETNLPEMAKLRRSYARRADWCDCWGRQDLLRQRRRDQDEMAVWAR